MKAVFIDTNIILRYLIADVPEQYEEAKKLIADVEDSEIKGKISLLVVNELIWILENYYELERKVYIPKVLTLLALKNLSIVEVKKSLVVLVLKDMLESTLDFTDLYLFKIKEDKEVATFDKKLARL